MSHTYLEDHRPFNIVQPWMTFQRVSKSRSGVSLTLSHVLYANNQVSRSHSPPCDSDEYHWPWAGPGEWRTGFRSKDLGTRLTRVQMPSLCLPSCVPAVKSLSSGSLILHSLGEVRIRWNDSWKTASHGVWHTAKAQQTSGSISVFSPASTTGSAGVERKASHLFSKSERAAALVLV